MTSVLIADDNETVRCFVRFFVDSRKDLEVCADCADGQEALQAALALKPELVILDVAMPKLNGIEVASVLKERLPNTKIILFTIYGDYIGEYLAAASGVDVVLPKEAGLPGLLRALETSLPPRKDSGSMSRGAARRDR